MTSEHASRSDPHGGPRRFESCPLRPIQPAVTDELPGERGLMSRVGQLVQVSSIEDSAAFSLSVVVSFQMDLMWV